MKNDTYTITTADMILIDALTHLRNTESADNYALAAMVFIDKMSISAYCAYLDKFHGR